MRHGQACAVCQALAPCLPPAFPSSPVRYRVYGSYGSPCGVCTQPLYTNGCMGFLSVIALFCGSFGTFVWFRGTIAKVMGQRCNKIGSFTCRLGAKDQYHQECIGLFSICRWSHTLSLEIGDGRQPYCCWFLCFIFPCLPDWLLYTWLVFSLLPAHKTGPLCRQELTKDAATPLLPQEP